ncbi:serine hydrolase domain-containing protein [Dokdonella sp.]|uniref:serine hydrolase domain-containing protein n=1 Tax=Dokdonella sp. TaxID=2291710 RepID=UPI0025BDBE15|nr:serine hydrolase domain-containing protein [Dokdonella sp.]MBX3693368.1 beta-lactamase family protein [Dokdonella sp.]MCW5567196.1 beta-lactamase family protein [Dokdonella sp.]
MSTRFAVLGAGLLLALTAMAQAPESILPPLEAGEPSAVTGPVGPGDAELAAFVDGAMATALEDEGIAGAVVAVVDRSRTRLLRGYGHAGFAPARTVDPETTLFRLGSVSKTFTYLAAMQLAEQGRLDLQAEVNRYLPAALQLPDEGWPAVRVHHLLTHTAGFEDSALGHLFRFDAEHARSLENYLATYRPRRVRAPGQAAVYSNYSVGLLGAIVARVVAKPFEAHVAASLFVPLGMQATRFSEPATEAEAGAWSQGFVRRNGHHLAQPFEIIAPLAPAGSASSTGADMARYLRMLLGGGELDGVRVLGAATFAELSGVDVRNADAVGGIANGFFRERHGRHESLEHGGATLWFHSNLVVLPDAGLGVFVSTNTASGRRLARELPRHILEFLLADARPSPPPAEPSDFAGRATGFVGTYLSARRNFSTFEKMAVLLDGAMSVRVDGNALVIDGAAASTRYVEESPLVFRAVDSGQRIAFQRMADGSIGGYAGSYGHTVFERVGFIDKPSTFLAALGVLALTALGVLLCAWRRGALPERARIRDGRAVAFVLIATAAGWLIALVLLAAAVAGMLAAGGEIVVRHPTPALGVASIALHIVAVMSLFCALAVPAAWRARGWSAGRRLRHVFVVLVFLGVIALGLRWKLLFAPLLLGE